MKKKFRIEKIITKYNYKYFYKFKEKLSKLIKSDSIEDAIRSSRSILRGDDEEMLVIMTKNTKFGDISEKTTCKSYSPEIMDLLNSRINNQIRSRRNKLKIANNGYYVKFGGKDVWFIGGLIDMKRYNDDNYTHLETKLDVYRHVHQYRYKRYILDSYKDEILVVKKKCVGVELEFGINMNNERLSDTLVSKLGKLCKHLYIKGDGSLRTREYSNMVEMTIIALETEIEDIVIKTCEVLNNLGVGVNKTCGLHVHLDMRDADRDMLDKTWIRFINWQETLYATQPPSRRKYVGRGMGQSKGFCQKIDDDLLRQLHCRNSFPEQIIFSNGDLGRYCGINANSYYKYKTLEIRMHSGTTNSFKICNWIRLLLAIRDSNHVPTTSISIADLTYLGLGSEAIHYFIDRCTKFGTYVCEPIGPISLISEFEMPIAYNTRVMLPALADNVIDFIKQNSFVDDNFENYDNDLDYVTN